MKLYMFLLSIFQTVLGYKPVILVHGVMSEAKNLQDMKRLIEEAHPGTDVYLVKLYPELESFVPLFHQLRFWKEKVEPLVNGTDGAHLICHSQGGLICQGILEYSPDHNIHSFVALSSPMNGQFGVPDFVSSYMPWLKGSRESLTKYMYTRFTQSTFAISNYWKDPRASYCKEYYTYANYLPLIQNHPKAHCKEEKRCGNLKDGQLCKQRKKNFLKLKKLVLIGGPDDGVISPWQSSLFGYFDENYKMKHMKEQKMFVEDWFGLQTMFQRGDVHSYVFPNIEHIKWHGHEKVFRKAIEPYLI